MIVDDGEVAARLKALADQLQAKGLLGDPRWREAFLAVRRHVFVPRFWRDEAPGVFPARWRMVDNATVEHPDWLDAVYSNVTLATEPTGVPAHSRPGMHAHNEPSHDRFGLTIQSDGPPVLWLDAPAATWTPG